MSVRYRGDPYWTTAHYSSNCANCKKRIKRGDSIFVYPRDKALCDSEACGKEASRDFEAHAQ